jgi:leader peptidase (prepilin peptidase) / N-methyltransferase
MHLYCNFFDRVGVPFLKSSIGVAILPPERAARVTITSEKSNEIRAAAAWIGGLYVAIALPQLLLGTALAPAVMLSSVLLGACLVALSAVDLSTLRLPDAITLPLAAAGLVLAAALGWEPSVLWRGLAAISGYGFIWCVNEAYRRLRGQAGIGLGDAKLFAAAGAWLGFEGLPSVLLYGCAGALLYVAVKQLSGQKLGLREALPFGPFLSAGIWLVWLYGPLV